jgi:16S rRNA processing protein RimM
MAVPEGAGPGGPGATPPSEDGRDAEGKTDGKMIVLGRLAAPWGVKGWIKPESFTDPPTGIFEYPVWHLSRPARGHEPAGWDEVRILEGRPHGNGRTIVVSLPGVTDPESARLWTGREIAVPRAALPSPPAGQYYWADLEGCRVETLDGVPLGTVDGFMDMPANAVMVVRDGKRERWLPAVPQHLKRVDLEARRIVVDWDPTL